MASAAAASQAQRPPQSSAHPAAVATSSSSSQAPSAAAIVAGRSSKPATNGVTSPPHSKSPAPPAAHDSSLSSQHSHDRLLFLVANFVGCTATVTLASGDSFTGVFSAPSLDLPDLRYALKMARKVVNGSAQSTYAGVGEDHLMLFDVKDVVDLAVANVALDKVRAKPANGSSTSFRTDTDISGNLSRAERELTRWEPSAAGDLNNLSFGNAGDRNWDQFEANERLYNVKSDYNEEIYTTKIDRSDPSYRQRLAKADKLAREIEGTATTNIHQAEERGLADEGNRDVDEEERYSGVRRDLSSPQNRYTPPARRAPTAQTTVAGAPVDPAIISSQLARPDSQAKNGKPKDSSSPPKSASPVAKENNPPASSDNKSKPAPLEKLTSEKPGPNGHIAPIPLKTATGGGKAPPPTSSGANATQTVERDVLKSFKDFSANEKLRVQERQRANARKEKDIKLNDLKHWGMNFKLKNEVPSDMLGILAKDKQKQAEILEKNKRQALEKQQIDATKTSPAASVASQTTVSDTTANVPTAPNDRQAGRGTRNGPPNRAERSFQAQNVPSMPPPRQNQQPGNLGQRLQAQMQQNQQQQQQQQQQRAPPTGPAALDTNTQRAASMTPNSAVSTKFNPAAFEFRPNAAAASFSPSQQNRTTTTASPARVASFFGDKRPSGPRKSIRGGFNPVARMIKEGEQLEDAKKKSILKANGGIPHAYETNPRWPTTQENEDKKHWDCFPKQIAQMPPPLPVNGSGPYADQIPTHVQATSGPPQIQMPPQGQQQFQQFQQHRGNDHTFDNHRMHPSAYSSPQVRPQMMMQPSPMMGHAQPYGQPIQQFPMGGQPMYMRTPSQQFQGQHMATPMVQNHSGGAPYMNIPTPQGMPLYPPQFQFVPAQGPGGPGTFGSPRGAQMMVQQGSQQGQAPQFIMQGQPGQQVYMQHPQQMLRPGMMQQQQQQHSNYGSSHMMGQQFPNQQHRGDSFNRNQSFNGNQFPQQQQQQQQQQHQQQPAQISQGAPSGHQQMPAAAPATTTTTTTTTTSTSAIPTTTSQSPRLARLLLGQSISELFADSNAANRYAPKQSLQAMPTCSSCATVTTRVLLWAFVMSVH
ncbi:hypothetical protein FH972_025796 [Carpinus fangiana]|uniref:LsmAD domain-containing protein n=1 Tax=Carpinus fangiana TaxID=176857 RepID=A0A5N6L223_9ROSI|nr:hypothetical protein FH972_025796 [Carpinus fangiana]